MAAHRMPFSNTWVISNWFDDEQSRAVIAARRRRVGQVALAIALLVAGIVGFGALAVVAVDAPPQQIPQAASHAPAAKR